MFPHETLSAYVLEELADELTGYVAPEPNPLQCDRYVARSALQKGCRRGAEEVALQALANLLAADPNAIWRHLTVITLEDVGVPGIDILARIVASRSRVWRAAHGGDWKVASYLVRQMCDSIHCQAACDLLLLSLNSPRLACQRADALEADLSELANELVGPGRLVEHRAMAALAIGGGLAEGQRHGDPHAVLDLLADGGSSQVVAICRAAWRISRNEMALLLPLAWPEWMHSKAPDISDDEAPPTTLINGLPTYALDQFTRLGGQVARSLLAHDNQLRGLLAESGIPRARQPRAVGDLRFLSEGSCLARRAIWPLAERLRRPYRQLPVVDTMNGHIETGLRLIGAQSSVIADLCRQQTHRSQL